MVGCMPPRDILLTLGNEIMEAPLSFRSRWYEYLCCRPLLEEYFNEDPNMRWEAAPKPRLTQRTYKKDFWETYDALSHEERIERTKRRNWVLTEAEPLFDAADVARFGKDLIVAQSSVGNGAGISWLRRHFPDHRIHVAIFNEERPVHIDASLVPLRPGLVLSNPSRVILTPELTELFRKNDWEVVEVCTTGT